MKRSTTIPLIVAGVTLAVVGMCAYAWYERQQANTFYTDADTIQESVETAYLRDILWTPAEDLGPAIDSPLDETEPAWSADGSTLFFVRTAPGESADIWTTRRDGSTWTEPQPLAGVNSEFDDLGPEPSRDGSAIVFYSNRPGGSGGYDLWITLRAADGSWGAPRNLGPHVNTVYHEYGPAIAPDGTSIYFASNRPSADDQVDAEAAEFVGSLDDSLNRFDYDLYTAPLDGATTTGDAEPIAELNSPFNDGSPTLAPFNDFVYFTSDRPGGLGEFDLYRARLLRGQIHEPRNLGDEINSEHNEIDPAIDRGGFAMYFASDRPFIHDAPDAEANYNLYWSTSREVFRETAAFDWAALWKAIAPALLWLLIALLAILALLYILKRLEYRRLSLLARCLLASVFVHFLILFLMSLWAVTTGLSDVLSDRPGLRVAITSSSSADSLAQQVRGQLTDVPLEAPTEIATEQAARVQVFEQPTQSTAAIDTALPDAMTTDQPLVQQTTAAEAAPVESVIESPDTPIEVAQATVEPAVATPAQASRMEQQEPSASIVATDAGTAPAAIRSETATELAHPATHAVEPPPVPSPSPTADAVQTLAQTSTTSESQPTEPAVEIAQQTSVEPAQASIDALDIAIPAAADTAVTATEEHVQEIATGTPGLATSTRTTTTPDIAAPNSQPNVTLGAPAQQAAEPTETTLVENAGPAAIEAEHIAESSITPETRADAVESFDALAVATPTDTLEQASPNAVSEEERLAIASAADDAASPGRFNDAPAPELANPIEATEILDGVPLAATESTEPLESFTPASDATDIALPETVESALAADLPSLDVSTPVDAFDDLPMLEEEAVRTTSADAAVEQPNLPAPMSATAERSQERTATVETPDIPRQDLNPTPADRERAQPDPTFAEMAVMEDAPSLADARDEPVVVEERAALDPTDLPSIERILESLAVPDDRALDHNPLDQRAVEQRMDVVRQRGGDEATERAVALALQWLAEHQSADGRWDASGFCPDGHCDGETAAQVDIALTGLATLAFLAADYTHTHENKYQDTVRRALAYLRSVQRSNGSLLGIESPETMYTHGIASIALAEAFAMTGDPELIDPVATAIDFIDLAANDEYGGWRYTPRQVGDTSVTGWQVMAMASAARGNIPPPESALDNAARWIESVKHPRQPGRYAYQPGRQYTEAMTAEAMFVRQLLGVPRNDPDMQASADYLLDHLPNWKTNPNTYYWYYGTLAMFHYQGAAWEAWNSALKRELLANQRMAGHARGSWDPADQWSDVGGRVYQTAICTLCLQVYYRYEPMYASDDVADAIGTIRGRVTDADTGDPLPGALIMLDLPGRPPISTRADDQGLYRMAAPEIADFFALSASMEGYAPGTATASIRELRGRNMRRDFELAPVREDIIAVEDVPEVHHLGNDLFEGAINSQFQKDAEGTLWRSTFDVTQRQLPPRYTRGEIHMLVKGAQARNRIRINGTLVRTRIDRSPRDGSYGEFILPLDLDLLVEGVNDISIQSVDSTGDIDDFEFINVRIVLYRD